MTEGQVFRGWWAEGRRRSQTETMAARSAIEAAALSISVRLRTVRELCAEFRARLKALGQTPEGRAFVLVRCVDRITWRDGTIQIQMALRCACKLRRRARSASRPERPAGMLSDFRRAWSANLTPAAGLALAMALAGCVGPLPYRPERQPFGATISADVSVREDRLLVRIDSEGYRVERAVLVRDGDTEVVPEALVPPDAPPSGGLSIGLGVGGGSGWGSYSVGTGVGTGLGGPYREATTLAVFRRDVAGPPPWRLRVKVVGVESVDIIIDPSRSGR